MSSSTKTYFLCPLSDFIHPPPAGPLRLGAIIRSTSAPQHPLNGASVVPVPAASANPPVVETDWKKTVSVETGYGLGVYAQFLQLATGGLSPGPEVELGRSSRAAHAFEFDAVTTVSFEPTPGYVEEAVQAPAVQAFLREPRQRFSPSVSLFLVTGMKLVKGARVEYSTSRTTAVAGNISVSVAPLDVMFRPKGCWRRTDEDENGFNRASEFVFAFRVKRLRIGRKVKVEEYNKGAFLANGKVGAGESVSIVVDDVDGSTIENASLVPDVAEDADVYCIPA
ncbi:hypothetical protein F5X97DRAFT_297274 [Nemania serpens]|nr:hypothetical protein F5X97DRAFT_297274 [Nemania serpens]